MDIRSILGPIWSMVKKYGIPLIAGYFGYTTGPLMDLGATIGSVINDTVPAEISESLDVGYGLSALAYGLFGWSLYSKGGLVMKVIGAVLIGWAAHDAMFAFGEEEAVPE